MKFEFLVFFIFVMYAESIFSKEIKIVSIPPAAEVWVRPVGNLNYQKIGETPFAGKVKDIVENYTKSEVFVIELRKTDHQIHRFIMSDLNNSDFELNVKLELQDDYALMTKIDGIGQGMFEVQRLIRAKNYDSAIIKTDELIKIFPRLSILYELKGSALYLNKKSVEALELYKEAFKYNPQNFDAFKMKEYLEKNFTGGEKVNQ